MNKVWLGWVLTCLLLLSSSIAASPALAHEITSPSQSFPITPVSDTAKETEVELETLAFLSEVKAWSVDSVPTSSDSNTPALARESHLLRENVQTKPIYWLVLEFNPPDPSIRNITNFTPSNTKFPWYVGTFQKSPSRLANWKDGNTLYTSRKKFH